MKLSITVDCFDNGDYQVWSQKKGYLTTEEESRLEEIKIKVKEILEPNVVGKIKWPDPTKEAAF